MVGWCSAFQLLEDLSTIAINDTEWRMQMALKHQLAVDENQASICEVEILPGQFRSYKLDLIRRRAKVYPFMSLIVKLNLHQLFILCPQPFFTFILNSE
jgi:hypothetical protein